MSKRPLESPSKRTAYMRQWRKSHPENAEYQRGYQSEYLSRPDKREAARVRAADWYKANRARAMASMRERYSDKPKELRGIASGERHPMWIGDRVGYEGLHGWVARHKGRPTICDHCGKEGKRHHWANIDHQYRRKLEDFIRLCPSCHYKYDIENGLQPRLNGRSGGLASAHNRKAKHI